MTNVTDPESRPESLEDLATRAIKLAEDAQKVQEHILSQQAKTRRRGIVLAISVVVDIALSISLLVIARYQAQQSDAIHKSQLAACSIGNRFRVGEQQVWDHFIDASKGPPNETPAARAARMKLLADARVYVDTHFRPVNCSALYSRYTTGQ